MLLASGKNPDKKRKLLSMNVLQSQEWVMYTFWISQLKQRDAMAWPAIKHEDTKKLNCNYIECCTATLWIMPPTAWSNIILLMYTV